MMRDARALGAAFAFSPPVAAFFALLFLVVSFFAAEPFEDAGATFLTVVTFLAGVVFLSAVFLVSVVSSLGFFVAAFFSFVSVFTEAALIPETGFLEGTFCE